ncbi:MAG: hypothetical protein GY715_04780 [Planctomycetes bacterium]|nr:hypothetical protein [Planctomycetota bacterium]
MTEQDFTTLIHDLLDTGYERDGDSALRSLLDRGADPNGRAGPASETPLHVAARRRRPVAAEILLERGAEVDAKTAGGKTAYAHAARRGFDDLLDVLVARGADTALDEADLFAVAIVGGRLGVARSMIEANPHVARTGNPEDDRLLADVAGRGATEPVALLIEAGADLAAPGLDHGTPLHQAAWFGQPANVELLIEAGVPLDVFDPVHRASPIGWAAHGSRSSGAAEQRQDAYVAVTRALLDAGAAVHFDGTSYLDRLVADASPEVGALLQARGLSS